MEGFSGMTLKVTWTKPGGMDSGEAREDGCCGASGGRKMQTTVLE